MIHTKQFFVDLMASVRMLALSFRHPLLDDGDVTYEITSPLSTL
ncbi:hypothetical protein [Thalassotalea euphylliae]|nr:hypothetical protein [Thalassotalea euphylliae]